VPSECEQCTAPVTSARARGIDVRGRRMMLCATCFDAAKAQGVQAHPSFEYRTIGLSSSCGIEAVEQKLNSWGRSGWRLLPITISGGQLGIMEREIRA
jgi:hypothetical protein